MLNTAIYVTIAIFMAGVVFQFGRLTARLEHLEEWRRDMIGALNTIHDQLREIRDLVANERG